ncbi:MAG: HAMP domain-containing histidine kinase, partial [Desulfobacula sp.]|nr:HAMP domain-containing histidine kinase [Desulfobacula sp.]
IERIKKMIMDILLYSKERKMQKKSVSIKGFLEDIQDAMAMKLKNSSVQFTIMSNPALDRIDLDPVFMMSALINILDNAIDACQGDETKEHHFIRFDLGQEKEILVMKIQDNGCGMDMETREKIFELFFSSKRNQGTGFGLFIAHSIITQHGGTIAVESLKRKGTTFTISLPLPEPGPNLDRQEQSKQGL